MSDALYMKKALDLSRALMGRTAENPSVGCVIVKNGKIIGQGATQEGGRPHAERQALSTLTEPAKGATAYVTLEPCSHHGQTPPCCDALIDSGISRCVIAVIDPDPRVNWRGAAMMQEAGIDVVVGVGEAEACKIMEKFLSQF